MGASKWGVFSPLATSEMWSAVVPAECLHDRENDSQLRDSLCVQCSPIWFWEVRAQTHWAEGVIQMRQGCRVPMMDAMEVFSMLLLVTMR